MDLKDLAFRFYESPIERLFAEIRSSAFPRIEVPTQVAEQLDQHLDQAIKICASQWDSTHPTLYRARRHDYGQFERFPGKNMGPPAPDRASAGRAQLAGAAMLYVADTAQTAIAEVKPDVGEYITVGTFRIKPEKQLRVLDLTRFSPAVLHSSLSEQSSLIRLSRYAFSAAVHPGNPRKYHAHAYFVQKIRDQGFDGIGYQSAVNDSGRCFAFFDDSYFRCTRTQLHQVKAVSVTAERVQFSSMERKYLANQKAARISKKGKT